MKTTYSSFTRTKKFLLVGLMALAVLMLTALLAHQRIDYTVNLSTSLPESFYIVDKYEKTDIKVGDYVGIEWRGGWGYPKKSTFIKIIGGRSGDVITVENRLVRVNGHVIGLAKPATSKGVALDVIPGQVIPEGKFFVYALSKDSLDSRYTAFGLVDEKSLIGKAYGFL